MTRPSDEPTWVLVIRNLDLQPEAMVELRQRVQQQIEQVVEHEVRTFTVKQAAFDNWVNPPDPGLIERPEQPWA